MEAQAEREDVGERPPQESLWLNGRRSSGCCTKGILRMSSAYITSTILNTKMALSQKAASHSR